MLGSTPCPLAGYRQANIRRESPLYWIHPETAPPAGDSPPSRYSGKGGWSKPNIGFALKRFLPADCPDLSPPAFAGRRAMVPLLNEYEGGQSPSRMGGLVSTVLSSIPRGRRAGGKSIDKRASRRHEEGTTVRRSQSPARPVVESPCRRAEKFPIGPWRPHGTFPLLAGKLGRKN